MITTLISGFLAATSEIGIGGVLGWWHSEISPRKRASREEHAYESAAVITCIHSYDPGRGSSELDIGGGTVMVASIMVNQLGK